MAATSLWHIEGRLKDLISYVENPEKTVPNKEMQDFFDVFSYVKNPEKTDNGEFVSAINCSPAQCFLLWGLRSSV